MWEMTPTWQTTWRIIRSVWPAFNPHRHKFLGRKRRHVWPLTAMKMFALSMAENTAGIACLDSLCSPNSSRSWSLSETCAARLFWMETSLSSPNTMSSSRLMASCRGSLRRRQQLSHCCLAWLRVVIGRERNKPAAQRVRGDAKTLEGLQQSVTYGRIRARLQVHKLEKSCRSPSKGK